MRFSRNRCSQNQILLHLHSCDNNFKPALSKRVNLANYSRKILLNAERFEALFQNKLVGLLACYLLPLKESSAEAFITNLSVLKDFENQGVGSALMREMFSFCKKKDVTLIRLKVSNNSSKAYHFYLKHNFVCIGLDENDEEYLVLEKRVLV